MKLFTPTRAFYCALAFTLAALCLPARTQAQYVTIPDSNFVTWLQAHGYAGCMNGNELDTTCPAVVNATNVDCSNSNISDLAGVQYFDNLEYLQCQFNSLTSLPALPAGLTTLRCNGNQLSVLPFLPNTVVELHCQVNQLISLPALPAALTLLNCYQNQLTGLPVLPSPLTELYCNDNLLSQLPTLPDGLVILMCYNNQLASLPTLPPTLETLYAWTNLLTTSPPFPPSLTAVSLYNNLIEVLPPLPEGVVLLNLGINQLTELPALPGTLQTLSVSDNPNMRCLPPLNNVTNLYFSNTAIACIPYPNNLTSSSPPFADFPTCGTLAADATHYGETDNGLTTNYYFAGVPPTYELTAPSFLWSTGDTTAAIVVSQPSSYSLTVNGGSTCEESASIIVAVDSSACNIALTFNTVPEACGASTGSVSVTAEGGTLPYTYEWSDGNGLLGTDDNLGSLSSGSYHVWVTDANGCVAGGDALVGDVNAPVYVNLDDAYVPWCQWGTAVLTPNIESGTAPYQYNWSTGETTESILFGGLTSSYGVTVTDANGCSASDNALVTTDSMALNAGAMEVLGDPNCFPGETLMGLPGVTDGTPPYSFMWSTGATTQFIPIQPAVYYSVTVSDASGCSTVYADYRSGFAVTVDSVTGATCGSANGSIQLSEVGEGSSYTFLWSNDATTEDLSGLAAGTYTLTVTALIGECPVIMEVAIPPTLLEPPLVQVSYATGCNELPATLDVLGGYSTYEWGTGETTPSILASSNGDYFVTVTDANGCTAGASATVAAAPTPLVSISGNNTICGGSSTSLMANIGVQFLWSTGETGAFVMVTQAGVYGVTVTDASGCTYEGSDTVAAVAAPSVAVALGNVSCDLSSVELSANASDGTAPYSYLWSNGVPDQSTVQSGSGPFGVTVTDANNCSAADTIAVLPTPPALVTFTGDSGFCSGSTATVSVSTSFPSYLWSNGATTQSITVSGAGTYGVTVFTAEGCPTGSNSIDVTAFALPTLTTTSTNAAANDGSIDLTVSGTGAPFTYSWSNGQTTQDVSGLNAGTYSVTVTTVTGCSVATQATVQQSSGCSMIVAVNGVNPTCYHAKNGSALTIVNGGSAPFEYQWSNNKHTSSIFNVGAGTYSVTVTDANGCTAVGSVTLTQPDALVVYTTSSHTCPGACTAMASVVVVSGGTQPYTYQWSDGATSLSVSGLCAGVHWVTITDAHGCKKIVGATVTPTNPSACNSGNPNREETNGRGVGAMRLYPNPTDRAVTVVLPEFKSEATLRLINTLGQTVYMTTITEATEQANLDLSDLAAGVYTVTFESRGAVETVKLVKQ